MIHVLNSLPKEYDVILDGLENHLTSSSIHALTIKIIRETLSHGHEKFRMKMRKREKKKRQQPIGNSIKAGAVSVVSVVII